MITSSPKMLELLKEWLDSQAEEDRYGFNYVRDAWVNSDYTKSASFLWQVMDVIYEVEGELVVNFETIKKQRKITNRRIK
jgi:hypothetical protein